MALKKHTRKHGFLLDHDDQLRFDNGGTLRKSAPLPRVELDAQDTEHIFRWIVSGSLPFSVIENKEFVSLIRLFYPTYVFLVATLFQGVFWQHSKRDQAK